MAATAAHPHVPHVATALEQLGSATGDNSGDAIDRVGAMEEIEMANNDNGRIATDLEVVRAIAEQMRAMEAHAAEVRVRLQFLADRMALRRRE